jgi:DHA2 family multidrug resistance protein
LGLLLGGILLGAATDSLVQAVSQVAALEFAGSVSASADEGSALMVAYGAGKVFGLIMAAPLILAVGMRRALTLLLVGQILCNLALAWQSTLPGALPGALPAALVGRAVQGLLGGGVMAGAYAALVGLVPKQHHAVAQGLWGTVTLMLPAVFAALGGSLTDASHWQHAMLVSVPLGLGALAALRRALPPGHWPGSGLWAASGLATLLWALVCALGQFVAIMGTRYNWDDVWWMGPVIVGFGAALALLLVLEWPKQALLHRGPLARPEFAFACLTSLVSGYGLTATAMLAPLYVRRLFGFAAQDAGVLQLPSVVPIGLALGVSVVATQRNWLSASQLIVLGMAMFLASLGLWSQATSQVDMGFVATVVALRGGALGLMAVPTARLAFARLDDLHAVYAAGYYQSARQWGGALATLTVTWRLAETQSRFH